MKRRARLTLEQLEVRDAPAVDILVTGDTSNAAITITGTDDSEQILINFMPGATNQIQIFALTGTTLNLNPGSSYSSGTVSQTGSFVILTPVPNAFNLTINMGGGNDNVTLYHTVPFTSIQIGTLTVDLGAGNDLFSLQGQGVANTRINNLVFDAGVGNDQVIFDATQLGDISGVCRLGDGDDSILLKGSGTRIFQSSAPWELDLGKGNDSAQFLDTRFGEFQGPGLFLSGGGLIVRGRAGDDRVDFGGTGALLSVNNNLGYNLIANQLLIDLGKGNDRLTVPAPSNSSHTNLFYARNNDGSNAQIIMGPTVGDGNDRIRWGNGGGTGQSVRFGNIAGVAADVEIRMGSGNDRVYIRNAEFQLLTLLMEDGDDRVDNNWGSDGVTVNTAGSTLNGGAHSSGDTLATGFTAPANLSVSNFNP